MRSRDQRVADGKTLRDTVPRQSHAGWTRPPKRRDPIDNLKESNRARLPEQSMLAVKPILEREGVRTLAVVTSPYHQRRAAWTARRMLPGVEIVSSPADPSSWRPAGWWKTPWNRRIVVGEYAKLAYYILRGWA